MPLLGLINLELRKVGVWDLGELRIDIYRCVTAKSEMRTVDVIPVLLNILSNRDKEMLKTRVLGFEG